MTVLCLGSASDDTFVHTLQALQRAGVGFAALDLAQLAHSGQLVIPLSDPGAATVTLHGERHRLRCYGSAWVRLMDIGAGAPSEGLSTRATGLYRALTQLFAAAPIPVVNPVLRDISNSAKLFHAATLAAAAGWRIPRSCLTRSPDQARAFIATCGDGVIFKGASGAKTKATLFDAARHDHRLSLLPSCPTLFQERIDGPDVRVHVVAERPFAELIESPELDYRFVRGRNVYRRIDVPSEIAAGCATLTRQCGMPFLGVDFKLQRSTDEWFFLEANSMPCYEGYDRRAGGAIAGALVDWLAGRDR